MRFLHAADIHLDSPLRGLAQYEGAPVDAIRSAPRSALTNLVRLAIDQRVDLVVLAGDQYDGDWKDFSTGLFFVREIAALHRAGIPVVMIAGNHDAASQITKRLTLPPSVHVLSTEKPETVTFESIRVAVHGQGFASRSVSQNLAAGYPPPVPGYFNVGVLHTSLDGRDGHDDYAPCTLPQLIAHGYDYWALGHVHTRESVAGIGRVRVEFPGNIQGRHIRETGPKGCLIVSVDAAGSAEPEFHALDVFRWERAEVDARSTESVADAAAAAVQAIHDLQARVDGRPFAVRVVLTCPESVRRQIDADPEAFRADLIAQVPDDAWIEKVKLAHVADTHDSPAVTDAAAAEELEAALQEVAGQDYVTGPLAALVKALPAEVRDAVRKSPDEVFERARAALLAGSAGGDA
ncbi:MAG: DNA repair exonuclease [Gemmataceae bacterium]|nr:DNA repair exonuclease [Gemmataceae bacterium]